MKAPLKKMMKISPAYALQAFAVILLFGYAVASPTKEMKETMHQKITPLQINHHVLLRANHDSLMNRKINEFKNYFVKSW